MLRHFLAALAYGPQKALRCAWGVRIVSPGPKVRMPHELIRHMDSLPGYAGTYLIGGSYSRPEFTVSPGCGAHFHEVFEDLARHLRTDTGLRGITAEILLEGRFSDAMTHAGQWVMLPRLARSPLPPEDFIFPLITAESPVPHQAAPVSPDAEWPQKP